MEYSRQKTGFTEVETPVLLRSSVEGAREFLVPTRTSNASAQPMFYALQQSPQQPKQLLIASGAVERYFQIAKCFRDEDGRKDRQPEFTQIDLEMAFVSWGLKESSYPRSAWSDTWRIGGTEVRDVVETLIKKIWRESENTQLPECFKVMTYHEAMSRFGSDKPDTRFGIEIQNITDHLPPEAKRSFEQSQDILECIILRQSRHPEFLAVRKKCEREQSVKLVNLTEGNSSTWLLRSKTVQSPDVTQHQQTEINEALGLVPGDCILLSRRSRVPKGGSTALGQKPIVLPEAPHFLWITEFPLFTRSDGDKDFLAKGRWSSSHHPFTAPMWEDVEALYHGEVESIRGQHYDLVLNGMEIGGGSVRVHDAAMQDFIFSEVLKLTETEKAPFSHLLHALRCGAPPHGGIALGFDRLMSILCKTSSIRDVIAFPKTSVGTDLLFKSPGVVDPDVLTQYSIQPRSH
ncbi:hypothetical protein D9758_001264 [Tetrapyrgos nigripes]|uniref:Aminoacyl-transfer RNA synthetases class-II family profile domain-containing protein n=1 Tax=Tetrapyrgos nigripes TaxID=182062 RepID=A0A8H5LUL4_9AGAR|nr:hypothetical protein D9758_001264 [Tetrapyrgos nigripes]